MSRRALLALAVLAVAAGGCVYYPDVKDVGGVRLRTENGRAVRQGDTAAFYVDLNSTGKYGDVITGVLSPVARQAQLISGGAPVDRLEVPGATTMKLAPGGDHVVLSDFTRPLVAGETIIVTLMFEKSGGIGVVTVVE